VNGTVAPRDVTPATRFTMPGTQFTAVIQRLIAMSNSQETKGPLAVFLFGMPYSPAYPVHPRLSATG